MTEGLTSEQRRRVERGTPMVDQLTRMMVGRLRGMTDDDLRSAGYEALVRCGLRYDPATGIPFRAYAYYRVRGAMIDAARQAMPAMRRRARAMRVLETSQALLEQAQARESGDGPEVRTLQERVKTAADLIAQATTAVLMAQTGGTDPDDVPATSGSTPEETLDQARIREQIRRVTSQCSEDEQAMLHALYTEGLSMSELGQRLGRNKSTISRRHATLLQRLSIELAQLQVSVSES